MVKRLVFMLLILSLCISLSGCSEAMQNEKNKAEQDKNVLVEGMKRNEISKFQKITFEDLVSSNDDVRVVTVFENREGTVKYVYSFLKQERYIFKAYYSLDKKQEKYLYFSEMKAAPLNTEQYDVTYYADLKMQCPVKVTQTRIKKDTDFYRTTILRSEFDEDMLRRQK